MWWLFKIQIVNGEKEQSIRGISNKSNEWLAKKTKYDIKITKFCSLINEIVIKKTSKNIVIVGIAIEKSLRIIENIILIE